MKKNKNSIYLYFIITLLVSIIILFTIDDFKGGSVGDGRIKYDLFIQEGDSASSIIQNLSSNGMIKSSKYFKFLLLAFRNSNKIKQGVYEINDGMNSRKIIQVITEGRVKLIHFTIPEGFHNRQIASLLKDKKIIDHETEFLKASENDRLLNKYKIPADSLEGYLFPETYSIPTGYPVEKIVEMMVVRFFKKVSEIKESSNLTPNQLHNKVILASIIEREAKLDSERPMMSGVFLNRIEKEIPLESCATVQYLFDKPKQRLLEKHLKIESPYNTYLHKGFPPGPISNPGFRAILAAFNPKKTEYLYFLVKPDGSHYFSKTFQEHLEAKKKYIDVLYN